MPRTPEQFEKIREGKRKQIMDAALELFAKNGYQSTSISMIAKSAGISKGLMYNYFKSKEELLKAVMTQGMEILMNLLDPNKDGILTDEEFEFFVIKSFETLKENTKYWRLYFNLIMQLDVHALVLPKYQHLLEETMKLLVDYFERHGVKDPLSEAILFGSVMDGISMTYILNPEGTPLDKLQKSVLLKFGYKKN